jgi:hypothetical protein
MTTKWIPSDTRISGLSNRPKPAPIERLSLPNLGQRDPQQRPSPEVAGNALDALGEPLSIREVSQIIGCSTWAIRQRYIPQGLPCLRSGPVGKLIFYRHQVVRWILQQQTKQQKGGR